MITKEMASVLDAYFMGQSAISGNYPNPGIGFPVDTSITITRATIEQEIDTGKIDIHPGTLDALKQLKTKGKITSNYFPWIKQRAKELLEMEK